MKKVICYFLCCITILITSCKEYSRCKDNLCFSDSIYNFETDWQYYYGTGDLKTNVTAAPDGYYICSESGFTQFIDKASLQIIPLCGKINCDHKDKNTCDAYIQNGITGGMGLPDGTGMSSLIKYYKGKLYYIIEEENNITMSYDQYLACADLDGTNVKKVSEKLDFGRRISSWLLHREYFYGITSSSVYRVSLNNYNKIEEVFSINNYDSGSNAIRSAVAYGDDMYIKYAIINEDDYGNYTNTGKYTDVHINLNALNRSVCDYNGKEIHISTFSNGKVLFSCESDLQGMSDYYYADLDFTEFNKLITLPIGETITTDGNYYYKDNGKEILKKRMNGEQFYKPETAGDYYGQTITIYDMDMNEVDSFILPSKKYYDFLSPQDPNVFILFLPDDNTENKYTVGIIEKSKIGTFHGMAANLIISYE